LFSYSPETTGKKSVLSTLRILKVHKNKIPKNEPKMCFWLHYISGFKQSSKPKQPSSQAANGTKIETL
jgi:hypothetical protein